MLNCEAPGPKRPKAPGEVRPKWSRRHPRPGATKEGVYCSATGGGLAVCGVSAAPLAVASV